MNQEGLNLTKDYKTFHVECPFVIITGVCHVFICAAGLLQSLTTPAAERSRDCFSSPWLFVSGWIVNRFLLGRVDNQCREGGSITAKIGPRNPI